ncbi:MAG TPA: hypothetical protein PLC53_03770, partial [Bacilli bacterium]|nr:hypothetical protein [Bacilli bacterium]
MKKILFYATIGVLCIFLVGCSKDNSTTETSILDMVSTEDKLVFEDTNGYLMILDYNGDQLNTVEWVITYETEEETNAGYETYIEDSYSDIFNVEKGDNMIILT